MSSLGKRSKDEVAYLLELNDDNTQITFRVYSGSSMTAEMFLHVLNDYVAEHADCPNQIFDEACEMIDERH